MSRDELDRRGGEADAWLRTLFETMTLGVVVQTADGAIAMANPAAEAILGRGLSDMRGRTSHDETWQAIREDGSRLEGDDHPAMVALRTGQPVRGFLMGVWNPRHDRHRWLRVDAVPLFRAGESRPGAAYATFSDVTELRRATGALRESEESFRSIIESSPMGVHMYRLEEDGRLVFQGANPAADRILGVDNSRFVGMTIEEAFPPLAETEVPAAYRRLCLEGGLWEREEVAYRDEEIAGAFEVHAFRTGPLRMATFFLDITARKRAEKALAESRERLELVLEGAELGTWDWDVMANAIRVDERWARIVGRTVEEIGTRPEDLLALFHPEDVEGARASMGRSLLEGVEAVEIDHRLMTASGAWVWVTSRGKLVERDPDGRPRRVAGTMLDVSARKAAEDERASLQAQVQQAQKLESLGVLAGGIAHDFNNLLCGVIGSADLALDGLVPGHPVAEDLAQIRSTAQRASELCRQLLAYSGKGRFVVEPIDLTALVVGMGHLLQVSISKRVVLRQDLARGLPAVEADATQLRQILLNLVVNASEAIGDQSGTITVSTGALRCDRDYLRSAYIDEDLPEGTYVFLEVADTGCGMDEDTKARLFDPFFSTKFTGRGLGLAATLGIVRGHRGAIKVYSEVGRGSTLKVLLPATVEGPKSLAAKAADEQPWTGRGTVLLVDDEPTVRAVGRRMLERLGFDVLTADDGLQALEVYRQRADDVVLVLLDMTMPHLGGEETFRELRRLRPDVRVVLTSGYNEQDATARFAGKGLAGFIQKPLRLDLLRQICRQVLEG